MQSGSWFSTEHGDPKQVRLFSLSLNHLLTLRLLDFLGLFTVNMSENAEALAATQKSRRNVTIEITNITNNFCLLDPK